LTNKPIILFKAVKELNIGIATAVELLEKGGFIVENKPTTKLTEEAYQYLLGTQGIKSSMPSSEQESVSQQKPILPLKSFFPFNLSPPDEDEITSFKVLEQIRKRTGIPGSVFKYFPTNNNSISSLKEHYLYHSVYTGFNDPFDCNMDLLVNFSRKKASYIGTKTVFLKRFDNTGICCFTTVNDSILMWSHYANHHKGFCLEFKSNNRLGGINPLNVVYKTKLKLADYHSTKDDAFYHLIYSKSDCWSYEHELRTFISDIKKDIDRKFSFEKDDLLSVYLGVRCSLEDEHEIKTIIKDVYSNKVNLYKAKFANNSFSVVWEKAEMLK
jgi:hypothetical protein